MEKIKKIIRKKSNFFASLLVILICAIILFTTMFCLNIGVEMEFDRGTATANGYELVFRLINLYMPGFKAKYIPMPPIAVVTAFATVLILITTLVNVIILVACVSLNRKPCILWGYLGVFLIAIVIVGLAVMCKISKNDYSRELTYTRNFKVGFALIIQPFLVLGAFVLSYLFGKGILTFDLILPKRIDSDE